MQNAKRKTQYKYEGKTQNALKTQNAQNAKCKRKKRKMQNAKRIKRKMHETQRQDGRASGQSGSTLTRIK